MNKLEIPVYLNIAHMHGGDEDRPMRIKIECALSGTRIIEADFTLEDFMRALTSQCRLPGQATLFNGPVGCKYENKTVDVPRPEGYKRSEFEIVRCLGPFEVEGWRGDADDLYNGHRTVGDKQRVTFRRYVQEDGTVWEPSE